MRLDKHKNKQIDIRRARALRNQASPVEKKLWGVLRLEAKRTGLHFRRQQPVGVYTADFACMEARLLIELDGESHAASQQKDQARDAWLAQQGFTILRISNDDVMKNVEGVVLEIVRQAKMLIERNVGFLRNAPHPNPPREGEGILAATIICNKVGHARN